MQALEGVKRLLRPPEVPEKKTQARRQVFDTQSAKGAGKDSVCKDKMGTEYFDPP